MTDFSAIKRQRWGGPSPWADRNNHTSIQKADDDPAVIRAEIIRLSAQLPPDDPLRIAIACAPRHSPRE